jgi:hypothetical protein
MGWSDDLDPTTAPYGVLMAEPAKKTGPWKNMTAEERSAEMKRRRAVAKSNGKTKRKYARKSTKRKGGASDHASAQEGNLQEHIAYLFGRVEVEVEHYARSNSLSFQALADGLAGLLRHPKGR